MPYRASLDWLNFLLADVRGGLGPYVSVFLLTQAHWDQAAIGAVLTISGLIGISLHTPVGALIDATRAKRALIIGGVFALSACALAIAWAPTLPVVLAADITMAVLGAVFAPTVAAITLGLVGREFLAARLARNAVFDRIGNLLIAAMAAAIGTAISLRAVFYLVPCFAVLTTLAVLTIPAQAIDHAQARGLDQHEPFAGEEHPCGWRVLLTRKPFLILAAALALFHFANAPMLSLASQKLALAHPGREAALTAAAIVVAQVVTIPMALLVTRADVLGRKPLLVAALVALPLRGMLYTLSEAPVWMLAVQVLDGVAGGLLDALVPLILADVMRGTGRYSVSRGFLGTVQGIGGSLSQGAAGFLVVKAGYDTTFLALAGVAVVALVLVLLAMPETRPNNSNIRCEARTRLHPMRFVAIKSANQQAAAVVFRTRDLLVRQRTQAINALRGHLAEFGVIAAKAPVHTSKLITVIEDPASDLPKWLERSWPYWSRNRSCRAPTGQNVH